MALQEIKLKLCDKQSPGFSPVLLQSCIHCISFFRDHWSVSKRLDPLRHFPHRVISLAVWSSPWMSGIEASPLLSVSTPIRSLLLSLASLVLLRWAREVTTFASVPRSP